MASKSEGGFSLIELLIVVAILPLVVGAICVALLAVFSNDTAASNSLTSSGDAQISSSLFVQDVQSAKWITTKPSNECTGVAGRLLLSVSSGLAAPTATTGNVISYVETTHPGSTQSIFRETCANGTGSASTTLVTHSALASSSLTIAPSPANVSSQWVGAQGLSNIELQVNEPSTSASTGVPNSYTLTATPRTTSSPSAGPGASFNPILPVDLVGTSCLSVSGGSLVDSQNGTGTVGFGGSTPCTSLNGHGSEIEATTPYQTGSPNPFQNLSPPAVPTTVPPAAAACQPATSTTPILCGSGSYTDSITNFGDGSGTLGNPTEFDPTIPSTGTSPTTMVVVFTQAVTIKDNSNVTFEGGSNLTDVTYWFEDGLTIQGSNGNGNGSTVTFGPATYIFGTPNSGSSSLSIDSHSVIESPTNSTGLIFYIPPGTAGASLASGTNGTILGSPMPYDQIALWDASSAGLTIGGVGGTGDACFGGIYVPNGGVTYQGNYSITSTFIVTDGATIGGGSSAIETGSSQIGSCQ